jgi:hypothetical protein
MPTEPEWQSDGVGDRENSEQRPNTASMKYVYTAAWRVVSGLNLPEGLAQAQFFDSPTCSIWLLKDPSAELFIIEQAIGFANCWLERAFTGKTSDDWPAELAVQTAKEAARRVEKTKGNPVLVVIMRGDAAVPEPDKVQSFAGMRYVHEAIDKKAIRGAHSKDIEAARLAVSLAGDAESARFQFLLDGVCLVDDDGVPIYSVTLEMHANLSSTSPVTPEILVSATQTVGQLLAHVELAATRRLYVQMADVDADPIRAFLAGWTALEILINKLFNRLESWFYLPTIAGAHAEMRARFMWRIAEVMKDKYRIGDKFLAVTVLLLPDLDEAAVAALETSFKQVKSMRDKITHGQEFDPKALPQSALTNLLRTYVRAAIKLKPQE